MRRDERAFPAVRVTLALVLLLSHVGITVACGADDKSSTFLKEEPGPSPDGSSPSPSGTLRPCTPALPRSVAAPVEHRCSDGGAPDAADDGGSVTCEDDLAACKRICDELLEGYDYCGVDDATDGGRIVRCTKNAQPCD